MYITHAQFSELVTISNDTVFVLMINQCVCTYYRFTVEVHCRYDQ